MIIKLFVVAVALFTSSVYADSLPGRIDNFVSIFKFSDATVSYDIRKIESEYPNRLLTPDAMLPQTSTYPLKDIQQLYHLSQTCTGVLPLSPLITEPLAFTRALCKGTKLAKKWFARSSLIHPGGGTYAARYIDKYPDQYNVLKQYMHIQERPKASLNSLLGRLQNMDSESVTALVSGAGMFSEKEELWLRKGDRYYIFPSSIWHENAEQVGLVYHLAENTDTCFVQRGNLCWSEKDQSQVLRYILFSLVTANVFLIIAWFIYRWNSKRRELRSRMLVLQILTHELRTPIASLSLTVEGFRREFEKLPETVYDEFRRLCEDSRRLRQLAEASKDYLQSDTKPLATEWVPSVAEWLEYKVEDEFEQNVKFSIDNDVSAKLNVYWLGTCIDNLLRNALKYGVSPVCLEVDTVGDNVTFKVTDQGQLTSRDWRQLRKPFVSKSGLGLGLTIVESMVDRMGGKLSLIGPPTTFILEIPCETNVASR